MSMKPIREMAPVRSGRPLRSSTDRACRVLSKYTTAAWCCEITTLFTLEQRNGPEWSVGGRITGDSCWWHGKWWRFSVAELCVSLPCSYAAFPFHYQWRCGPKHDVLGRPPEEGWRTENIWKYGIGRNDVGWWGGHRTKWLFRRWDETSSS